jgi:hypothetical protein
MPTIVSCPTKLGLIHATGQDARAFLHAQLTQSIADLGSGRSVRAAWLSAQGRVRALLDVIAVDDAFWLVTPADNVEPTLRPLRLFVLRADLRLDAPPFAVHAIVGDSEHWLGERGLTLAPGQAESRHGLVWQRLGPRLVHVIGEPAAVESALTDLDRSTAAAAELEAIRLGLPAISAGLRERYIPQMLNLERLGAVSFKKGCYPGQEIVARTENLGQVKRRLLAFATDPGPLPDPGTPIVDGSGEAAGEVNRAAPSERGLELLAVVRLDAASRPLHLEADPRRLTLLGTIAALGQLTSTPFGDASG